MPKYDPSSVSPLQLPAHTRDVFPFEFGVTFRVLATTLHPISFIPPLTLSHLFNLLSFPSLDPLFFQAFFRFRKFSCFSLSLSLSLFIRVFLSSRAPRKRTFRRGIISRRLVFSLSLSPRDR